MATGFSVPNQEQPLLHTPVPRRSVTGAAWVYPLKGIYFFLSHRYLHPLLRARLLPCFLLSIAVLAILFTFTYLPQVAVLAIFHGRHLAWINGAFLVLGEGAAIVALLFEAFLVDETLVDVFDAVLVDHGLENLVAKRRPVDPYGESNPARRLGKPTQSSVYAPFSFRQIIEFVLLLPLNFLPVVGTPLFLILTGYRAGPLHHWRYFKFLEFSKSERKAFVRQRQRAYTAFGTIALILQLIPVLSMFFLMTTAAGSALWVVRLEKQRRLESADVEPPYVDNV
ncbi:hypothetical protein L228DRAFT_159150 [Xylona heveae TC161]|uniref:Uncharacterized protein n=1 Tax=Xylona heveae (strain CBS 132557 / TC161) TaxID=1328760 RepID=A0A165G595_XYLHT|nr:hypothetical protein L228DRAFT_159150 [Xylona heveae TC161]KZF21753.1 hypothetical protein L228DRAFT_159150 [Xylona heveae TC161]